LVSLIPKIMVDSLKMELVLFLNSAYSSPISFKLDILKALSYYSEI
jgi:hypothetical protein